MSIVRSSAYKAGRWLRSGEENYSNQPYADLNAPDPVPFDSDEELEATQAANDEKLRLEQELAQQRGQIQADRAKASEALRQQEIADETQSLPQRLDLFEGFAARAASILDGVSFVGGDMGEQLEEFKSFSDEALRIAQEHDGALRRIGFERLDESENLRQEDLEGQELALETSTKLFTGVAEIAKTSAENTGLSMAGMRDSVLDGVGHATRETGALFTGLADDLKIAENALRDWDNVRRNSIYEVANDVEDSISGFVDNMLEGEFDGAVDSLERMTKSMKSIFSDMLSQMAMDVVARPIILPVMLSARGLLQSGMQTLTGWAGQGASAVFGGTAAAGAGAYASGYGGSGTDWMGMASAGKSAYGLYTSGLYSPLVGSANGGLFGFGTAGGLMGSFLPGTTMITAGPMTTLAGTGLTTAPLMTTGMSLSTALGLGALGGMGYSMLGPLVGLPQGQYSGISASLGGALGAWGGGALAGSSMLAGTTIATALGGMILPIVGTIIGALAGGLLASIGGTSHHDGTASILVGATSWDWGETGFDVSPGSEQIGYVSGADLEDAELVTDYLDDVAQASYDTIDAMVKGTPRTIRDNLQNSLSKMTIEFGRHNGWGDLGDIDFEEDIEAQLQAAGEDLADRIMAAAAEGLAKGVIDALESGEFADLYQVVQYDWDSMTSGNGVILGNALWEDMHKYAEGVDPEDGEDAINAVQEWLEKLGQMNALFLEVEKALDITGVDFFSGYETQMLALEAQFDNWLDQLEELGFSEEYIAKVEAKRADYLAEQAELIKRQAADDLELRRMTLEGGHTDELARKQLLTGSESEMLAAVEQWAGLDKAMSGLVGDFYDLLEAGDHAGAYAVMQQLEASFAGMGEEGQLLIQILHLLADEFNTFTAEQEKAWRQANQQLDIRHLSATGQDWEAQRMSLAIQQQEEYATAVDAGADAAYLAKLSMVQLAESAAFLAEHAAAVADYDNDLRVRLLEVNGKTLEAQLLSFDLSAARQREEAEALGADMTLLERVLAAERLAIVEDYNQQIADAYAEAFETIKGFADDIQEYLDNLLISDKSTLNPYEQLTQAGEAYESVIATIEKYRDRTDLTDDERDELYQAMRQVTGAADAYLSEARDYYASSPAYQAIFDDVVAKLGELPDLLTPEMFLAEEIRAMSAAVTTSVNTVNSSVNTQGGDIAGKLGLLELIKSYLDADEDGSLTFEEFVAAVRGNPRSFAEAFISQYDASRVGTEGYGYLSWDEVSSVLSADLWDAFNANNDLYLSAAELEKMFVSGESTAILEEMFHAWDSNGDGILSTEDTDSPLKSAALETNQILTVQAMLLTAIVDNTWSIANAVGAQRYNAGTDAAPIYIGPSTSQDVVNWLDNFPTLEQWEDALNGSDRSGTGVRVGDSELTLMLKELRQANNFLGLISGFGYYAVRNLAVVAAALGAEDFTSAQYLRDTYHFTQASLHSQFAGFAEGGDHAGGLRLVGEEGPELEFTGPARYWSFEDTQRLFEGRKYQESDKQINTKDLIDMVSGAISHLAIDEAVADGRRKQTVSLLGRVAADVGSIRRATERAR